MLNYNDLMGGGKRLGYIDALRGFSIISVVIGHSLSQMGIGGYSSVLGSIIVTFWLPIFFLISGFLAYKPIDRWKLSTIKGTLKMRFYSQIICPILFFALYAYIFGGNCFGWIQHGFSGYWFTIVLFQIYLTYVFVSIIAKLLKRHWFVDVAMIVLSVALLGVLILFRGNSQLWEVLCFENLTKYFQFFTLGLLMKKYFNKFEEWISKDGVKTAIILSYIALLLIYFNDNLKNEYPLIYQAVHDIFVRYAGLLVVYLLFVEHRSYFDTQSKLARGLSFIGRRTLDIYMIHYLLLPNLQFLKEYLTTGNMIIFQLFIAALVAAMVIACCLLLSSTLRMSKFISYFLFGEKSK
jgi:fucose 4-O-acetylase-like acetyltransferase